MNAAEENKKSKLSFINKENPFVVPEEYFENLPGIISERCAVAEKAKVKRPFYLLPKFYFPVLSGIAAVVVFILLFELNNKHEADKSGIAQNSQVSQEYSYLGSLIDDNDLEESDLVEAIVSDDTAKGIIPVFVEPSASQSEQLKNNTDSVEITKDDIIQYLLEEDNASDDLINL